MTKEPTLPLRWRLPIVLSLVVFALLALGAANALQRSQLLTTQTFERLWRNQIANLQRITSLGPDDGRIEQALAQAATDPAIVAMAVVDAQGRVLRSARKAWHGLPAAEALPGWDSALAGQAWSRGDAVSRWDDAQVLHMAQAVRLSHGDDHGARGLAPALLWITADAAAGLDRARWRVLQERLPDAAAAVLLTALLGLWMQRRLIRPLERVTMAAEGLRDGDLGRRAPVEGLPEIARLSEALNDMASAVQHAQTDLLASEQRLGTILYSTGDALLATDAKQRITLMNRVAEQLTGWREHEARGHLIDEIFVIENALTRLSAEVPVARVLAEGIVVGLANHTVLVARDGTRRHIADSAAPVRNADGTLQGVVLVFRDVTESWRLERALADSESHYRALADLGPTLVWTTDAKGHPNWVNLRWCEYTGQHSANALAGAWRDAMHPDDRRPTLLTIERSMQAGDPYECMLRLRRHDGVWRWMLAQGQARRDSAGALLGYLHTFTDVTAQREHDARRTEELTELQRWRAAMLGREARLAELKAEVNALCAAHGQPPRYAADDATPPKDGA